MFYSKEQLSAMSIWQLRDHARNCGHHSPTSQRKMDLVEFIWEKQDEIKKALEEGKEVQPLTVQKKRRGRPPKGILLDAYAGAALSPALQETPLGVTKELNDVGYTEKDREIVKKDEIKRYIPLNGKKNDQTHNANRTQYGNSSYSTNINNRNQYGGNQGNGNNQYNIPNKNQNVPYERATEEVGIREGILEICPDGYGFLRAKNCEQGDGDAYIAAPRIKKHGLRKGDYVVANVKKIAENRPWNVQDVITVNGGDPAKAFSRPNFDALTPVYPDSRLKLELSGKKNDFAIRAIDLVAPIGKGQRGMIVSPPKAGKTTLLKKIAHSISTNYPEAHLIVLLIDERPEEVTDMQRNIKGEVIFSTFDEMPEHHTKAAEMVLERAKRLVELGQDVVILMDSLTRLARAYNLVIAPTGKTLSGGIDPGALHNPKRFFGAARNIENGGSLTIIATALVDTGSRMDDVIYEEFKGTGNMEIHLDRKLSEKRIFPAIDLNRSGTRREELLLDQKELEGIYAVRKMLSAGDVAEATENLINMLMHSANNDEFIKILSIQIAKLQKDGYSFR